MNKSFAFLLVFALSSFAFAEKTVISGQPSDLLSTSIAAVNSSFAIEKFDSLEANTSVVARVVSINRGLSTDVSPTTAVYLAFDANAEMASGEAVYEVSLGYGLVSSKRISTGVYQIVVHEITVEEDYALRTVEYTIDANAVLAKLKTLADVEEFGHKVYLDSVSVTRKVLSSKPLL